MASTTKPGRVKRAAAGAVAWAADVYGIAKKRMEQADSDQKPDTKGAGTQVSNLDNENVKSVVNKFLGVIVGRDADPVISNAFSDPEFIAVIESPSLKVPGSESDPDPLRKAKITLGLKLKYLGSKDSASLAALASLGESTSSLNSLEQDLLLRAAVAEPKLWDSWDSKKGQNPKEAVVSLILTQAQVAQNPSEFLGDVLTYLTGASSFEPSRATSGTPLMAKSVAEELVDASTHAHEVAVSRFTSAVVSVIGTSARSDLSAHAAASSDLSSALGSLYGDAKSEVQSKISQLSDARSQCASIDGTLSALKHDLDSAKSSLESGAKSDEFKKTQARVSKFGAPTYAQVVEYSDGSKGLAVSPFLALAALIDALDSGINSPADVEDALVEVSRIKKSPLMDSKNLSRRFIFKSLGIDQEEFESAVDAVEVALVTKQKALKTIERLTGELNSTSDGAEILSKVDSELESRSKLARAVASDSKVAVAVSRFSSALASGNSAGSAFRPSGDEYVVDEKTGKITLPSSASVQYANPTSLGKIQSAASAYNNYVAATANRKYADKRETVEKTLEPFSSSLGSSDLDTELRLVVQSIVSGTEEAPAALGSRVKDRLVELANTHVYRLANEADTIAKKFNSTPFASFTGDSLTLRGSRPGFVYVTSAPIAQSTVAVGALYRFAQNWRAVKVAPKPLAPPSRAAQVLASRIGSEVDAPFWSSAWQWTKETAQAVVYWGLHLITHPEVFVKRTKKLNSQTGEAEVTFEFNGRGKKFGSEVLLFDGNKYVLSRRSWAALKFVMMATFWNSLAPAPENDVGTVNHARTVLRETTPATEYRAATWVMRGALLPVSLSNWAGSQFRRDYVVYTAAATGSNASDYRIISATNHTAYPNSDDLLMPFDSRAGARTFLHMDYGTERPVKPIVQVTTSVADANYVLGLSDSEAKAIFGLSGPRSSFQLQYLRDNPEVAAAVLALQSGSQVQVTQSSMPTRIDPPAQRPSGSATTSQTPVTETLPDGGHCVERANEVLCNLVTVTQTPIQTEYRLPRNYAGLLIDSLATMHPQSARSARTPDLAPAARLTAALVLSSDTLTALATQGVVVNSYELPTIERYNLAPSRETRNVVGFLMVHKERLDALIGSVLGSSGTASLHMPSNQRAGFATALYTAAVAVAPDGTTVTETPLSTEALELLVARFVPIQRVIEANLTQVLLNLGDDEAARTARINGLYPAGAARTEFVAQVGILTENADVNFAASKSFNRASIPEGPNQAAELARFDSGMALLSRSASAVFTAHLDSSNGLVVDTSVQSLRSRYSREYHVTSDAQLNVLVANPEIASFFDRFRSTSSNFLLSTDPNRMNAFVQEISTRASASGSSVSVVLGRMNPFETQGASLVEFCKSRGFYSQRPASSRADDSAEVNAQTETTTPNQNGGVSLPINIPMDQIGNGKQYRSVRAYFRATLNPTSIGAYPQNVRSYVDRAASEFLHAQNPNLTITDELRVRIWATLFETVYSATNGTATQIPAARLNQIGISANRATGTNNWTLAFSTLPPTTAPLTPNQSRAFAELFREAQLLR